MNFGTIGSQAPQECLTVRHLVFSWMTFMLSIQISACHHDASSLFERLRLVGLACS